MGEFYQEDEGPRICFNGPKIRQAFWFKDRLVEVPYGSSWKGKLYGIDAYDKSSPGDAVVIRWSFNEGMFLSYNLATGINAGAANHPNLANKVLFYDVRSDDPWAHSVSDFKFAIGAGSGAENDSFSVKVLSTGSEYAEVEVIARGDTAFPTPSPTTPPPTPSPTTPPPTPSPTTPPPTPNPTTSPTSDPTLGPGMPPTPDPTLPPFFSPSPTTPPPTSSPTNSTPPPTTLSPSPVVDDDDDDDDTEDDDDECVDDSTFFFKNKKGKKKFCNWFGKKKIRCFKKPGAIDACPVSCNLCDKTNRKICTDKRMKKKACKEASICRWNKNVNPKKCEAL